MNQLLNNGVRILRYPEDPIQKTIIVSGLGRSGTKAMIGSIYQCGIKPNKNVSSRTLDDWGMGTHLDDNNVANIRKETVRRNLDQDVWTFKWHMIQSWNQHLSVFRNPLLIVMFRDPLCVSVRSSLVEEDSTKSLTAWMKKVTLWQMQLVYCVTNEITIPTILVSYEKLINDPKSTLKVVTDFCGIPCNESAINFISPNEKKYTSLESTGKAWLDDCNPG